jgi:hypothetical protein
MKCLELCGRRRTTPHGFGMTGFKTRFQELETFSYNKLILIKLLVDLNPGWSPEFHKIVPVPALPELPQSDPTDPLPDTPPLIQLDLP